MADRQTDIRYTVLLALTEDAEAATDPLVAVELLGRCATSLLELLVGEVAVARTMCASWEQIGEALGITRQAAWQRYAGQALSEAPFGW